MAEDLVLARLTVDASGVVTGVAAGAEALNVGGKRVEEFGKRSGSAAGFTDLLTRRMFNLRTAAAALLGGFTIGGLALQLSSLVTQTIAASDAWKNFSTTIGDAARALLLGETRVEALARGATGLLRGLGLTSLITVTGQIEALQKAREDLIARIGAIQGEPGPFSEKELQRQADLIGLLRRDVSAIGAEIAKIRQGLFTPEQMRALKESLPKGPIPLQPLAAVPALQSPFDPEAVARAEDFKRAVEGFMFIGLELLPPWKAHVRDIAEEFGNANRMIGETIPLLSRLGQEAALIETEKAAAALEARFVVLSAAGQLAAQAIGKAIFEGGVSFKQAVAEILKSIAVMSLSMAFLNLALAHMASTVFGGVFLGGTPVQFKAAAAFFFKVAAISGGAALAIGGRGGEEGGGGRTSAALAITPGAEPRVAPTFIVIFEGSVVGLDPLAAARAIKEANDLAERDQAGR